MVEKLAIVSAILVGALALVSPDNVLPSQAVPGVVFHFFVVFVFVAGVRSEYRASNGRFRKSSRYNFNSVKFTVRPANVFLLVVFVWIAAAAAIQFYTGSGVADVITGGQDGLSSYRRYQNHFSENRISDLSIAKVPFILSLFILKFIVVYFGALIAMSRTRSWSVLAVFLSGCAASLVFSIARGTSIEMFELMVLFVFILSVRALHLGSSVSAKSTRLAFVLLFGFLGLVWYAAQLSARGVEAPCTWSGLCVDSGSFFHSISPALGNIVFRLGTYFSFGTYATSELVLWISSSWITFFAALSPLGFNLFLDSSVDVIICESLINCGVSWVPEIVFFFSLFGLFFGLVLCFYLGKLAKRLENKVVIGAFYSVPVLFFVMYFFMSLSVGKFVTSSSANILCIVGFVLLLWWRPTRSVPRKLFGVRVG